MNRDVVRASFISSIYFSCASFVILWIAGFLYESLLKTSGRLSIGWVIVIVLSLMLIMFFIALTHILLGDHDHSKIKLIDKMMGVLLFVICTLGILGGLGFLFWFPIG